MLAFLFLSLLAVESFHIEYSSSSSSSNYNSRKFTQKQPRVLSMRAEIAPRKALFFDIVESGLNDRFQMKDVSRVFKFCQYAKNEIPAPSPKILKVRVCDQNDDCRFRFSCISFFIV